MCTKSGVLADRISGIEDSAFHEKPFFNEFAVKCPVDADKVVKALEQKKILAGYPLGHAYPGAKITCSLQ